MLASDGKKRVLVTGASGFVGRQCLDPLVRLGYEVHAVRSTIPRAQPGASVVRWHEADLLSRESALALVGSVRPTHLLHLAWTTEPGTYWTSVENVEWVDAGLALFDAFGRTGGRRAAVAGTCAEYDWTADTYREDGTPLVPGTLYGAAKNALRIAIESIGRRTGVSVAWGRLFFLYGPHERPERLVPSVVRSLLADRPALCTPGRQVRDYLHVRDAGAAFAALLDSGVTGPVNLASGEPVTIAEIVTGIAERLGKRNLLRLGAREAPAGEPGRIVADTTRLREEVPWSAEVGLEEGLEETIAWWRGRAGRQHEASR